MMDVKKIEMKKKLLTSLKEEGRGRHAMRLKHRFAPPMPPPAHEDAVTPDEAHMDMAKAPAMPGAETEMPGGGDEMTKEKLIELLSRLG